MAGPGHPASCALAGCSSHDWPGLVHVQPISYLQGTALCCSCGKPQLDVIAFPLPHPTSQHAIPSVRPPSPPPPAPHRSFPDGFPDLFVHNATHIRNRHVGFLASFHDPALIFEQISIIYALPRLFISSFTLVLPFFPTGTAERVRVPSFRALYRPTYYCICGFSIMGRSRVPACSGAAAHLPLQNGGAGVVLLVCLSRGLHSMHVAVLDCDMQLLQAELFKAAACAAGLRYVHSLCKLNDACSSLHVLLDCGTCSLCKLNNACSSLHVLLALDSPCPGLRQALQQHAGSCQASNLPATALSQTQVNCKPRTRPSYATALSRSQVKFGQLPVIERSAHPSPRCMGHSPRCMAQIAYPSCSPEGSPLYTTAGPSPSCRQQW